jgi:hypothetical protein
MSFFARFPAFSGIGNFLKYTLNSESGQGLPKKVLFWHQAFCSPLTNFFFFQKGRETSQLGCSLITLAPSKINILNIFMFKYAG